MVKLRLMLPTTTSTKRILQSRFVGLVASVYFITLLLVCMHYVAKKVIIARFDDENYNVQPLLLGFTTAFFKKWSSSEMTSEQQQQQHQVFLLSKNKYCSERAKLVAQQIALHREAAVQRALTGPTEYDNIRVFPINHHPALNPMDPEYTPRPEWDVDTAIPDIAIVGLAKAGTTQLYRILVSHPNATSFGEGHKEFCLDYNLYKFFEDVWDDYVDEEPVDEEGGGGDDDNNDEEDDEKDGDSDDSDGTKLTKLRQNAQKALYLHHLENFFNEEESSHRLRRETLNNNEQQLLTVNACYHNWDTEMTRHYLLPYAKKKKISDQKYIVLFRDPADLLWSAFNYWTIPGFDYGGEGWAEEGLDYRSPELFHELLLAGNRTKWFWEEVHNHFKRESVRNPRKLLGMFGRDNVLFLRNEDMLPLVVAKPGGVLDRVGAFTGLQRDLFPEDAYSNVVNCNAKKMKKCGTTRSSTYRIAGNREMLPESRALIYLHFLEECKIWKRDFGIEYPNCLNILETTSTLDHVPDL